MTVPTKKIFAVGLNAVRIYALNALTGIINASSLTAYDGLSVGGPVTFSYEFPDPESVVHPGNNTVLQRDVLPSLDTSSGTLEVSRSDADTIALLNNTKVRTVGDANQLLWGSNQAGNEPTVGLVAYAQAKTPTGLRAWSTYVMKAIVIPKPKGMAREQANLTYFVQPQPSTTKITGETLTAADDGATSVEVLEYQSNYRMHFTSWNTTTSSATFTLGATFPMVNTTGLTVYVDGALQTSGAYTATTAAITFTANVAGSKNVTAMYELAESVVDVD
jgi:hypothetical protein